MQKFYLVIMLVFAISGIIGAQSNASIDQLNAEAESLLNQNPHQSIETANKAKSAALSAGYKKGTAVATAILGVANYKIDAYDWAKAQMNSADSMFRQINDTSGMAFCKYWLGNLLLNKGQYNGAFDFYQTAYALAEAAGDKKDIARSLDGKASIYEALNEDDKALELYKKSLAIAQEINFKAWYPGEIFSLGNLAYAKGNLDSAVAYYNEAIKLSDETGNLNNKASCYQRLSSIYFDKKDTKLAMQYAQKAMDLFQQTGSTSSFSYSRLQMCYVLLEDKQYDMAINFAKISLEEGKANGETELQKNAAEVLYYAYLNKGDKGMALDYHIQFHDLSEASHNEILAKKLALMDLEANFEKERAIAKAEQAKRDAEMNGQIDKQRLIKKVSIIGIFLFAVIAGLSVFAFNQKRKDSALIAKEKSRTDELLMTIMPEEIVEEIKKGDYQSKQIATVLFANVRGLKSSEDEEKPFNLLSNELEHYFKSFDEIIARHKIEKIKTIGDAYLCIRSLPVSDKDNAREVVAAALELQHYARITRKEKQAKGEAYLEISIGVHTGSLTGNIIGIRKASYDIWGDTVNIAARLEQHSEDSKINISMSTYELVKDKYICLQHGEIQTKGKQKVEMFFVQGTIA